MKKCLFWLKKDFRAKKISEKNTPNKKNSLKNDFGNKKNFG